MINVGDPDMPEAVSFEDFERSVYDRRKFHRPMLRDRDGILRQYVPPPRPKLTGITLHQTACNMGERIERYDTIGSHWAVLRSGNVIRLCDDTRVIYHGHGWNNLCTSIEVDGRYSGLLDDPSTAVDEALRTTWNSPSTPERDLPQQVTEAAMRSTRMLVRWIVANAAKQGHTIKVLCAHRQASKDRQNDPGQAIWQAVALPLHRELGLGDGGPGFKIGDGYPISTKWNPAYRKPDGSEYPH